MSSTQLPEVCRRFSMLLVLAGLLMAGLPLTSLANDTSEPAAVSSPLRIVNVSTGQSALFIDYACASLRLTMPHDYIVAAKCLETADHFEIACIYQDWISQVHGTDTAFKFATIGASDLREEVVFLRVMKADWSISEITLLDSYLTNSIAGNDSLELRELQESLLIAYINTDLNHGFNEVTLCALDPDSEDWAVWMTSLYSLCPQYEQFAFETVRISSLEIYGHSLYLTLETADCRELESTFRIFDDGQSIINEDYLRFEHEVDRFGPPPS